MNRDINLRTVRGFLAALITVAVLFGWLLNDLVAGEPWRWRGALVVLVLTAAAAGAMAVLTAQRGSR